MTALSRLCPSLAFALCLCPGLAAAQFSASEADAFLERAAEQASEPVRRMSFEEFRATVTKEPGPYGKYIVNGDTPIADERELRRFYDRVIARRSGGRRHELIVATTEDGVDAVWDDATKMRLTYCVSRDFGQRHAQMVRAMEEAARAWESVARLDFVYVAAEDDRCTPTNEAVVFDVRPGPENTPNAPFARAFFPDDRRTARNVLVWESSFATRPPLTLEGILRHELGHAIGLRHEHTRPESGTCFEDENWRGVTAYDALSVMHYPQCNGLGDWSLVLTERDKSGIACVYGPAPGFTIDPEICEYTGGSDPFGGNYGAGSGTGVGEGPIGVTLE